MRTKKMPSTNLLLVIFLGLILGAPALVQASDDHYHNGKSHHYDPHNYASPQCHHYKKYRNKHRHGYGNLYQDNYDRYNRGYMQPRRHYNNYVQPGYGYSPITYATPVYIYPPNVTLGINSGNTRFMLRY